MDALPRHIDALPDEIDMDFNFDDWLVDPFPAAAYASGEEGG